MKEVVAPILTVTDCKVGAYQIIAAQLHDVVYRVAEMSLVVPALEVQVSNVVVILIV